MDVEKLAANPLRRTDQTPMKVVFRTDASVQIGTGHVMRCLTLAHALRERGAQCAFLCRDHPGHLIESIAQRGHPVITLPRSERGHTHTTGAPLAHAAWLGVDWQHDAADCQSAIAGLQLDWLVVDHYALDRRWESALRHAAKRLMVIDDIADRAHDCDLLLDANLGRHTEDYAPHVAKTTTQLIGPTYALLRPEFSAWRAQSLARRQRPSLKRLLIGMGGTDPHNMTSAVLAALERASLPAHIELTVLMGQQAPGLQQVKSLIQNMARSAQLLIDTPHVAEIMSESDLMIGASGGTAWERCCLGLPCLLTVIADNQITAARHLQQAGAALVFHKADELANLIADPRICGSEPSLLKQLSDAAARITDGKGAERVIEHMEWAHD